MNTTLKKYSLLLLKILVAVAFIAAGTAKLTGAEMMVATFDNIGAGQWFRYLTGAIEVTAAILLFIPGTQAYGAAFLLCTMIGAVFTHWFILGPSAVPALVLGTLATIIVYVHRQQFNILVPRKNAIR
ncbi:MAG: DoxX family protein [Pseudomonadales bacterium]|nr:DoxX family protein [Pseudomonadales bacterium]NRA15069.1 DoxX family protein [Oceanospirillaceae bacterium]